MSIENITDKVNKKAKIMTALLMFFLCLTTTVLAQSTKIDSLIIELQNHKEKDTIKVNLLYDLGHYYRNKDFDKALMYLDKSIILSDALRFTLGKARGLYEKGIAYAIKSNYTQGLQYYTEAIDLYASINFKKGQAECYKAIGRFFYKSGDQKKGIEYYKKSLNIYEDINNTDKVFILLMNIGWSYILMGDYDVALTFYEKALTVNEKANNEELLTYCLTDIGIIYTHKGNYFLALEYFNKAIIIGEKIKNIRLVANTLGNMAPVYSQLQKYDKAIECFKESIEIFKDSNKEAVASNLNNIGLVYKSKKDYAQAQKFIEDGLKIYIEINNKSGESFSLNNIGDIHLEQKKYKTAYAFYKKATKINLEVGSKLGLCHSYLGIARVFVIEKEYDNALSYALKSQQISNKLQLIDYQRDVSELLVEIYKNTNNYKKAFQSHQQFKILSDSLFNKKNIEKIAQLEYEHKYKQALDSASIKELQLTKAITTTSMDLEQTQRKYLWAVIGVLLVSMLLGSVIFYQKLNHAKAKTQNAVIEQKLLRSQMTPHFLFNSLSVLQGMVLNKEYNKSVNYLSKFSKLLRITLENSRDKTVLLEQELKAIQNYLTLQNLENNAYQSTVLVEDTIDVSLFEVPPMLIQPFVENAIEHAFINQKDNKKIDIRLAYLDKKLICTITDNGIGYKSQMSNNNGYKKSLSTAITSERLKILSKDFKMEGSVTIEDRQKYNEQGTVVTLVIPHKILVA